MASPWGEAVIKIGTIFMTDEGSNVEFSYISVQRSAVPSSAPSGHLPPEGEGIVYDKLQFEITLQNWVSAHFASRTTGWGQERQRKSS